MSRSVPLASALLALMAGTASAQQMPQGERVAGTVKSATASDLVVATVKGDVDLAITPRTRVLARQSAAAGDIKPGAYLGTANQDGAAAGTGTANEIHLMENGPNVNYPMNSSGLTMTNGHVKSVKSTAQGQEIDIDYGQAATRHVMVGKDTQINRLVDVGAAGLMPGATVSAMATTADGKLTATYISILSAAKP